MSPDISVVLCTWNRAVLLRGALDALVSQQDAPPHEILIVDNASTDDTRSLVHSFARLHPQVRYESELRQGLSFARNTGTSHAKGRLIAFTDDDVRVGPGWMAALLKAETQHPEAAYFGGPVIPAWPSPVPRWLTERHWAPLGVQQYGSRPLRVDASQPLCLIGANLTVRRDALERIGPFDAAFQRVGEGAGSTEDQEWQMRAWAAGCHGVYDPSLEVSAVVGAERVRKRHHRAWHFGHGRHIARMRLPDMEQARYRLAGVPSHLVRSALADAAAWCARTLAADATAAFERETRLCFAAGFVRERWG
jgi:glycosyltransferase involved in cell wall biosynthesis